METEKRLGWVSRAQGRVLGVLLGLRSDDSGRISPEHALLIFFLFGFMVIFTIGYFRNVLRDTFFDIASSISDAPSR